MQNPARQGVALMISLLLAACNGPADNSTMSATSPGVKMKLVGSLKADELLEASGLQASYAVAGDYFVHNDDGNPDIYVIDSSGADLGVVTIVPAKNKDWEDITSVPVGGDRWIVAGDIGDNMTQRKFISLYFARQPLPDRKGRYGGMLMLQHRLDLNYPDGPRDCESLAYDPQGKQLLLLSKRDKPPHLYAIDLDTALSAGHAQLNYLGNMAPLRAPTQADQETWGGEVDWISQPTGMDISTDGSELSIITYRSLYRYRRAAGEDWLSTLQKRPAEVVGPPAVQNEAIAYSPDGKDIYVTTEKRPATLYQFEFSRDNTPSGGN